MEDGNAKNVQYISTKKLIHFVILRAIKCPSEKYAVCLKLLLRMPE